MSSTYGRLHEFSTTTDLHNVDWDSDGDSVLIRVLHPTIGKIVFNNTDAKYVARLVKCQCVVVNVADMQQCRSLLGLHGQRLSV